MPRTNYCYWTILSCSVLALAGNSAICQKSAFHSPAKQPSAYATSPIDLNLQNLSPSFIGHDAAKIFANLQLHSASYTKSDFETSADFDVRSAEFANTPILNSMRPNDLYGFSIAPITSYDADSGVLTVKIADEEYYDFNPITAIWKVRRVAGGSYVGSNAFGVKKTIQRIKETDTDLRLDKPTWLVAQYVRKKDYSQETGFLIQVEPNMAQRLSRTLAVLVIGSLTRPFATEDRNVSDPTITYPIELTTVTNTIHVGVRAIWLYDIVSGEVVKKIDSNSFTATWPLRVELRCNTGACSLITGQVDGNNATSDLQRLILDHIVNLHAQNHIHLEETVIGDVRPEITVTQDGEAQQWICKIKYQGSSIYTCSIDLNASNIK